MTTLGHITLNISLIIYFVYFIPQIVHNQLKQTTEHISLYTHTFMIVANLFDLLYGFGFHLEWQYRLVTILTLIFLFVQQLQILKASPYKKLIFIHTIFMLAIIIVIVLLVHNAVLTYDLLIICGLISTGIYWFYWLPQIFLNYKLKKTDGFSHIYINLTIMATVCDFITAVSLGWPFPSIISPVLILFSLLVISYQNYTYRSKKDSDLIN